MGRRIKEARDALGLTQKQLADRAGIGKTAMFDLEHGNPGVRLNTLLAVLSELEMDLHLVDAVGGIPQGNGPAEAPVESSAVVEEEELPDYLL